MTLALSWFNGIGGGGDTARARCGEGIDGGIDASMVEVYETGAAADAAVLRSAVLELLGRMSRASLINPPTIVLRTRT